MDVNEQPKDPNILMNLGLELCRSGKIDEGLTNYAKAFDILSKMPGESVTAEMRETLLTQYSAILFSKQKYSEITCVLTSKFANKYGGLNASQHYLLGISYYKLKKINESVVELKLCINKLKEQTNSHPLQEIYQGEPHYLLAVSYAVLNRVKEAEREFNKAIKENPDSYKFNYDYARFLAGQCNLVKALEFLNKIIPQNPSNPAVWQLGARIALNNRKLTEFALDWTQEALKFCPDNPELIEYRADALLLNGHVEEAIECFERLPESARRQASIIFCEIISGVCNKSYDKVDERVVSYELIRLYHQCLNAKTVSLINCFHKNFGCLQPVLPTAFTILKQAIN